MASKTKNTLANDAREAMNAVVQIHAQGYDDENVRSILEPRFAVPTEWTGTGFFIEIEGQKGYILTNSHVARNAKHLHIMSPITSEEMFEVELVGLVKTQEPDIALLKMSDSEMSNFLKVSGGRFPSLELGDSNTIRRGVDIKAIGYPLGMEEPNISGGEVSNFIAGDELIPERLVTDAAINPGNSGGPSIIEGGTVIGLNTAIIVNANNIGFVTPINFAKNLLEPLITWKYAKLTDMAAKLQKNSEFNANFLGQKKPEGLIITYCMKEGMLDAAGLKPHDILLGINDLFFDRHGVVIDENSVHRRNIYDVVRLLPVGSNVKFTYMRDGKRKVSEALAIPRPNLGVEYQPIVEDRKFIEFQGMVIQRLCYEIVSALFQMYDYNYVNMIENYKSNEHYIVITHTYQGSPADAVFLECGDIISKVNGKSIHSLEDFQSVIKKAQKKKDDHIFVEALSGRMGCFPLSSEMPCEIMRFGDLYDKNNQKTSE